MLPRYLKRTSLTSGGVVCLCLGAAPVAQGSSWARDQTRMPAVTTPDPQPAESPGSSRVCCSDGVNSRGTALGLPSSEKPGACPDSAVWLWGNAHPRKGRPRARRDRERAALHHADGRQGLSEAWALCAPGRRLPGGQDPAEAPPSLPRPPTRSKSLRRPGRSNAHGPPASRRRPESHGQPTPRGGPCAPAGGGEGFSRQHAVGNRKMQMRQFYRPRCGETGPHELPVSSTNRPRSREPRSPCAPGAGQLPPPESPGRRHVCSTGPDSSRDNRPLRWRLPGPRGRP